MPIPKSISYAAADQHEFEQYHGKVMAFLRGGTRREILLRKHPTTRTGAWTRF